MTKITQHVYIISRWSTHLSRSRLMIKSKSSMVTTNTCSKSGTSKEGRSFRRSFKIRSLNGLFALSILYSKSRKIEPRTISSKSSNLKKQKTTKWCSLRISWMMNHIGTSFTITTSFMPQMIVVWRSCLLEFQIMKTKTVNMQFNKWKDSLMKAWLPLSSCSIQKNSFSIRSTVFH